MQKVATWPQIAKERLRQSIFMFVNRGSGGQRGESLMTVKQPLTVDLGHGRIANLLVFDMLEGPSGEKPGFMKLKEETHMGCVRIVVAGGDGTILWAIEECEKHSIDTRHQVLLAVMPLGTGNDFSRFAGWGGAAPNMQRLLRNDYQGLRELVRDYVIAKPLNHDVWRVDMTVDDERGTIMKTGKERRKERIPEKAISKLMHSYFSAGNDARAGMSQEKARTSSRWGNQLNYAFQICLKGMPFRAKEYVRDFTRSMHHGKDDSGTVIFREVPEGEEEPEDSKDSPKLVGNPQVIIVLNIPNCYGGFCEFWKRAGSLGVSSALDPELMQKHLDPSDGKLEVLTYGSILFDPALAVTTSRLPAQKLGAKRVFTGAPLFMRMAEDDDCDVHVHVQIDGEFFKLKNPTSMAFELHRKIRVLHSHGNYEATAAESDDAEEGSSAEDGSSDDDELFGR